MRIILAESGQEFETSNTFSRTLSINDLTLLREEIEQLINIKPADQILLTRNGIQLKDDNLNRLPLPQQDQYSIIILFNRRLLQNPSRLLNSMNQIESDTSDDSIPTLKDIENDYLSIIENNQDDDVENIELMNQLKDIIQNIIDNSTNRKNLVEKLTKEIAGQFIALDSALNNLESHVRTAYQTIGKFDRIAQREFLKHEQAIKDIQADFELLKQVNIHPRILNNIVPKPQSITLDQFVPLEQLESMKSNIIKQYNDLVNATLEQKNKVTWLNQQTANVSINRTTSDMVTDRVTKLKNESSRYSDALVGLQKKIMGDFNRRRMQYTSGMDGSSTMTIRPNKRKDMLQDAFRSLYLHMSLIKDAEQTVLQEKKTFLSTFIRCMQSISQVEESVSQIYPSLATLEKRIKSLRVLIEKGQGAIPKRIITGYGILLIELWRRDKYLEITTKNASLLSDLFDHFGKREEKYRKNFVDNEILCLQDKNLLLSEEREKDRGLAILPFQMQDMRDPPVLCQTLTTSHSNENQPITKRDVEDFIQLVSSYYFADDDRPKSNSSNRSTDENTRNLSHFLSQKLERESKRLNKGLIKLGLPNINSPQKQPLQLQKNTNMTVSIAPKDMSSPLLTKSISTPTYSTATSVSQYYTPDLKPTSPTLTNTSDDTVSQASTYQQQRDWELERITLLRQSQEYKKYIEDIQHRYEQDRLQFEKEKQLLLRELGTKDRHLQEVQKEFNHIEQTLKSEQEKYHLRIIAKDKAYATLEAAFRETKSAPTSPPVSPTISKEKYDHDMNALQLNLNQLTRRHQHEINQLLDEQENRLLLRDKQWSSKLEDLDREKDELLAQLENASQFNDQQIEIVKQLEESLKNIQDKYTKVDELSASESRLKHVYMVENAELTSRLESLIASHKQKIIDIQEANEIEKRTIEMNYQNELETIQREFNSEKSEWTDKVKRLEQYKEKLGKQFVSLKKEHKSLGQKYSILQNEQKSAVYIAKELLSLSSSSNFDTNTDLINLLKITLGNVANLQSNNSVLEQSIDVQSMLGFSYY